jgi:hypothetical protein
LKGKGERGTEFRPINIWGWLDNMISLSTGLVCCFLYFVQQKKQGMEPKQPEIFPSELFYGWIE